MRGARHRRAARDGPLGRGATTPATCFSRVRGRGDRTLLLCAHLDTVPAAAPVDPVLDDGAWVNANDGILGADNKAAVAVLLEIARRCSIEGSPLGLELVFTTGEEVGLLGAKRFDTKKLSSSSATCSTTRPRSARS